jgi:RNA polymerase sigma factor (sigma-70 family)
LPEFDVMASTIGLSKMQKCLVAKARHARQLTLETDCTAPTGRRLSDVAHDRPSVDALLNANEERAVIRRSVGRLGARERAVVTLRYGLEGETLSITEIGRRLGCSREWVRKIELRSRCKLRADLSRTPQSVEIRVESLHKQHGDGRRTMVLDGVVSTS